jgi:methanogenic corrinoid protein MtbC1
MRLFTDLFQAAQQHVEERWHVGEATVEDEYAVYLATERALAALPKLPARNPDPVPPAAILLATLAPEEHDLGVRLLAASFAEAGWTVDTWVRVEGPDLLAIAARDMRRIVGISATFMSNRARATLAATVAGLKAAGSHVLGGGAAFNRSPVLGQQLGIDLVATDARFAVLYAGRFLRTGRAANNGTVRS